MQNPTRIGILAYHGDVIEHAGVLKKAFSNLKIDGSITFVRTKKDIDGIRGIIIPGGESSVMYRLSGREGIFEDLKNMKNIFGTCAGAIMLAKKINHKSPGQKTLELMDIEIDRNAYGRQTESFETPVETVLGRINAVFIRAPKIVKTGKNISVLAHREKEIIACEQKSREKFYLAACFHPELTTQVFHEYFLKNLV